MVRHRWIFPRPRRRRVSVLAYRKGQGCQVQGRFDDQKEEFPLSTLCRDCVVREGKQKRKKKKKKKKGREEEEEEGERKGGEASLSLSLRHVYRSICLLLVQGPISQRTALLHSRVRSPRGNAASKPWLPWLPSPSRSRALCSTRTWCLQTRRKKASTTSRHRADCNDQIFLCGFTPSEWTGTKRRTATNRVSKPLIGNPGGWSWAIFFYYPRFVGKKRRFSEIHESSSL